MDYDDNKLLLIISTSDLLIHTKHQHERHSKYRLEDEELTHHGQSLGEINKFEDVQLSDDEDYNDINDGGEW